MQALLVCFIFTVFLCFAKVALSNQSLLQQRADLTRVLANIVQLKQQEALLHRATKLGEMQVVEQLIADGVRLSARDEEGKLAYEIALDAGHFHLAVMLLKKIEGISGRSSDGLTPLNIGLAIGDAKLVRAAIKEGASIFAGQHRNLHALHVAERMEQEEMLLRALVAEDRFGNFGDFGKNDEGFIEWISERKLIPVIEYMLADPQLAMSSTVRAKLAVLADDEVMFQQALAEGAYHPRVWQLLGFRPQMFEQLIAHLEKGSLHHAAVHGKREAMAALLAAGADINAVDGYGWSALDYAVLRGQAETTRDLCKADADVCVFDQAKYMLDTDAPTVEILRSYASDKDPLEEDWLHYYLRKGQTARAINHIKSYYDPNKLIYIGVRGADDVGKYKHREDIDGARSFLHVDSALHAAALYGDLELVKYLVETMHMGVNYADTGYLSSGNTALNLAAVGNHVDVASYLLARGADVHGRDRSSVLEGVGLTAMHYAAAYGNLEMAVFLEENGGDVNAVGYGNGYNYWSRVSTLQLAIEGDANLELVEFLIKKLGLFKKRKINRADGRGLTPLYRAIRTKNVDMVELLLVNGADPAVINDNDEYLIANMRYNAKRHKDVTTLRIVELLETYLSQR